MKTLADLKRTIKPGTRVLCLDNNKRPELNGLVRIVFEANSVGFNWRHEGDADTSRRTLSWTRYEKAKDFLFDGSQSFVMRLGGGSAGGERTQPYFVRLEILAETECRN